MENSPRSTNPPRSTKHVQALHDFARFVDNNLSHGHDVLGRKRPYLSRAAQQRHWARPKLSAATTHEALPLKTIESEYLGVFSMLVYCNQLEYFTECFLRTGLDDKRFPLLERPAQWPHAPFDDELWAKVQEYQNLFFPLVLSRHLSDHEISPDRVLPISEMTILREGDVVQAKVYKIKVDPAYNELVERRGPDDKPKQDTFALKVQSTRSAHRNEVTAFNHFQTYPSAHIIDCHGSFTQSGKYCLILEYVDGGDLETFMQRTRPPQTPKEHLEFWRSYSGYLKGIHSVHQLTQSANHRAFKGLHGDIKPDNMLLKIGQSGSPYDFIAKIADFGYSHFRRVDSDGQDGRGLDRRGNQQYCAPEASHHLLALEAGPNHINFTADIFSLGAVTSEVITWVAFGSIETANYFEVRKQATDKIDAFRGSGYGGCFHDGVVPLQEVFDMHKRVRKELPEFDHITRKMLELVEEKMLLGGAEDRSAASDIEKQFEIYHQEAAEMIASRQLPVSRLSTVSLPPSPPTSPPTSSPSQNNRLSPFFCTSMSLETTLASDSLALASNGYDQPVQTGACTPPTSPIPDSQQPSPFGGPQLRTTTPLDGVHICNGTESEHVRPGPSLTVRDIHSNPATQSFTTDASASGSMRLPPGAYGTPQPHLTADDPSGQGGRTSMSSARIRPFLTLDQLRDYYKHKKDKSEITKQLIGDIQRLQKYIKGRDHMFYFDDSDSMAQFKVEAGDAFKFMSYVAKQVDKDGIEVVFGSDSTRVIKKTRTKVLLKKLHGQTFDEPRDKMAPNFDAFVRGVLVRRLPRNKDLSVLIFTDGNWGNETEMASGVERAVKHLMEEIVRRDLPHTRIILSFVRFGNDELGIKRLSYLDDLGKKQTFKGKHGGDKMCDNVDTGSVNGNICKLFIGSVIEDNDDEDDYPGVISPSSSTSRGT